MHPILLISSPLFSVSVLVPPPFPHVNPYLILHDHDPGRSAVALSFLVPPFTLHVHFSSLFCISATLLPYFPCLSSYPMLCIQ
ncbi:hypothetical protein BD311DRAFT_762232 [Dichomitus squalens]|uniref:Uncharacterized protein n=1 Tax=Dichomitus squalens TaxID=114155 RepID=A0A4Q9MKL9_9APHY|nr:hypothetical protein BD311DRAFT_762232 [Dichomitus squalens]